MENHQGFLGESAANHVEEDEEEEENVEDEDDDVLDDEDVLTETEDEVDIEADNEQDSSMILTDDPDDEDNNIELCDKETNTDVKYRMKKREAAGHSGALVRRSQTFSPSGRPGTDYICKV